MKLRLLMSLACAVTAVASRSAYASRPQQRQTTDSVAAGQKARALDTIRVSARAARTRYSVTQSASATRTDLPVRDTPRSLSIVTAGLIADQSMQNMADAVRYTPGVSMASGEGHRDAPTIRGNSTTADFFVDGVRDDAQYLRDLYNVDRIEVLKGAEALLFGRGGGGGIINRETKRASWENVLSFTTEGGSFDHKRGVLDVGAGLNGSVAGRMTGMYEKSGGFRDASTLTRFGVNPTLALMAGPRTIVRLGYQLFDDRRRVDRGIPSYRGAPASTGVATFFGNPSVNRASSHVNIASASIEHRADYGLLLRNRTTWEDYDKFYQNTLPGAVSGDGARVSLSAYNHAIARRNVMNTTDATYAFATGGATHTLLAGMDLTRQHTDQVRLTGYFNDSTASYSAPLSRPTVSTPVTFRVSATDANNLTIAKDASLYVQDQVTLGANWIAIAGARYERFDISYLNNRTGQVLSRSDALLSPRGGLVYKPATPVSFYASYGVSFLPSSGDQFTALTVTTSALEPERFTNRELGAKWDVRPELGLTAAIYRLDRTNTSAPDPNNGARVVQTGAQRTTGWELGMNGSPTRRWQMVAGVGSQRARIQSTTSAAKAGATVAIVPHSTLSLWNRYQVSSMLGVGVGVIHQTEMYAAVDNTVTLPGFTRLDGAIFANVRRGLRAQLNIENALDTRYFATTQGNNNIMPGAPRTIRLGLTAAR